AEEQTEFDSLVAKLNDLGAWDVNSKIMSIIERLEIDAELEVSSASAGLKRRALLGRELASDPDILLLDEPTNHLDIDSVLWLEKFLKSCGKTLVFVSHDRDFLRNLANRVVEVDRGKLIAFDCKFDEFISRRDELLASRERNEAVFDKKLAQEEAWLRQGIKARRTRNEGRVRELMKLRQIRAERREKLGQVNIRVQEQNGGGQKVLDVKNISKSYNGTPIIKDFSTTIFRGDKIGIIGRNGIGKTTLLNILLGSLKADNGEVLCGTSLKISYFDQLRKELDDNMRLFDFIGGGADFVSVNGAKQNVMGYLQNFLFSPEQALSDIGTLSGGEKNRLMLAKMFSVPANVLVLDEPTNDLDMPTIDILENALMNFDGTVLLVSHDRSFLNNIVNCVFCFDEGGEIVELAGGYDEWAKYKERKAEQLAKKEVSVVKQQTTQDQKKRAKLSNKERAELESIPSRIEEIEAERAELSAKLEDSEYVVANFDKLEAINKRLEELNAEDEYLMQRWEELDARA
ncbi:MAG: ATP-binding cassette domain-containing protein, partial [Opitutales bacterium]|nr:ATP-binding cassette domain-containing protein [Opitutales bacterium]